MKILAVGTAADTDVTIKANPFGGTGALVPSALSDNPRRLLRAEERPAFARLLRGLKSVALSKSYCFRNRLWSGFACFKLRAQLSGFARTVLSPLQ